MNIINTDIRSRLLVPRLAKLMFVSLVGPSLQEFQPLPYVKQWLLGGHVQPVKISRRNERRKARKTHATDIMWICFQ